MKVLKSLKGFLTALMMILSGVFTTLSAAGPITHALLTENLFRLHPQYDKEEQMAFRAGTLFSGIRNLRQLSEEETSFPNISIDDILSEPSPFLAGMMFHSLVDELRDQFIANGEYLNLLSDLPITHSPLYLKFLDDQIMFPSLDKTVWLDTVNTIHPEELVWGVDEAALKQWHYLLNMSFSYQPSTLIFFINLQGNGLLGVPASEVSLWNQTFDGVSKRADVQLYVTELLKMFKSALSGN